ncbi:MAG TPA: malic enzyme-like NAD(P)-binding protein [Candidatus Omnitrophota bacterium]|nr:malic enzyme-like NAD(P)-binding protein [Candidatus Omnitrophota bacterium]HPS20479.1 malic enzyme-like NAD(P)-binding protein [Candidatus Omnitrophota bacterium]
MAVKKVLSKQEILKYHLGGKIGLSLLKKLEDQRDLSMAYTPGVSQVCKEIENDPEKTFSYTSKGNLVAVVTDGTAVLGLGNIGPKAGIPVMEGKAVLFKAFAGVDGWPVPLEGVLTSEGRTDVDKVVETVKRMACMFGGINLEDIAGPECFEVEDRLSEELDIPVFHDDQWGTAIIALAAVTNYCLITKKRLKDISIVINGAGAAGLRIADMLKTKGASKVVICDSKGTLNPDRKDLNAHKKNHIYDTPAKTLADAMKNADVFIGVSAADCVSPEMVQSMADYPAIMAMANPNPEIAPEKVAKAMKNRKYIMATGRSDYANQVNNVLGFPYIFRGALDVRAKKITIGMKIAAAEALAALAHESHIPEKVKKAYGRSFEFGPEYIIPKPFDPRIIQWEATAVAKAAIKDGVARIKKVPKYEGFLA